MEEAANGGEEIVGGFELVVGAVEIVCRAGPGLLGLDGVEEGEPLGEVVIAQTAGALFDVRLDVEDGVAVFSVAGAGHLGEVLNDGIPLAQDDGGKDFGFELRVELAAAG